MNTERTLQMLRLLRSNLIWSIPVTALGTLAGFLVGGLITMLMDNNYFAVMIQGGSTTGHEQTVFYIVASMASGLGALLSLAGAQLSWFIAHRDK